MKSINKSRLLFWAAVFLFALISSLTATPVGDDYLLYYAFERPEIRYSAFTNGRYIANRLAYLIVRYPAAKICFMTLLLSGCILLLAEFTQIRTKRQSVSWLALALFALMPAVLYTDAVLWLFAFAVHLVPVIFTLLYMRLCFRDFAGKAPKNRKLLIPLCILLGFGGAFFVEHVSIFNVVFACFVLLYAKCSKQQKPHAYQAAYAAAALLGLIIMLINPNYSDVAAETESATFRTMSFDLTEILFQIYTKITPLFAKKYFLLHLLIAAALCFLYLRADASGWSKERRRYAKLSLGCIAAYALYAVFNAGFVSFVSLTASERMGALECAFAFLYVISLLYLSYVLTDHERFVRIAVYVCGTVICAAPFCIVNPVTPRCFFVVFCLWLLLALEVFTAAAELLAEKTCAMLQKAAILTGSGAVGILCYINGVNGYVFRYSVRDLKEQLDAGKQNVDIVTVPYPDYTPAAEFADDIVRIGEQNRSISDSLNADVLDMYLVYMLDYYNLDKLNPEEFHAVKIEYRNYTM